jgi:hypothetical protein
MENVLHLRYDVVVVVVVRTCEKGSGVLCEKGGITGRCGTLAREMVEIVKRKRRCGSFGG